MITEFKIFEGKYVNQIMYHFTSEQHIIDIIKCDCLKAINTGSISVTRDKYLHNKSDYLNTDVRIVLDINKISNNYKVEPYQQVSNIFDDELKSMTSKWKGHPKRDETTIESEEIIKTDILTELHKYIISIDFKEKDKYQKKYDKDDILDNEIFLDYMEKYNIIINDNYK